MGLKIGNINVSLVNDHNFYSDDEILFRDVILAHSLLDRVDKMSENLQKRNALNTKLVSHHDIDLDKAVKKLLE